MDSVTHVNCPSDPNTVPSKQLHIQQQPPKQPIVPQVGVVRLTHHQTHDRSVLFFTVQKWEMQQSRAGKANGPDMCQEGPANAWTSLRGRRSKKEGKVLDQVGGVAHHILCAPGDQVVAPLQRVRDADGVHLRLLSVFDVADPVSDEDRIRRGNGVPETTSWQRKTHVARRP